MTVLVASYLVLFLAVGAYSVVSDWRETPRLELLGEAVAVVVLAAGLLFWLFEIELRRQLLWLVPVGLACLAELGVVARDRRRIVDAESLSRRDALATDVLSGLFFLPAVLVNVTYALR